MSSGKCKINWEQVCRPKQFGSLGILNLKKFATALHLRWLWLEWDDPPRAWCGTEIPCGKEDRNIFAAATKVTIGDGTKAKFWESPWLDGVLPKDIAPKNFELSRKKCITVASAIRDDNWVSLIDISAGLSLDHLEQFFALWSKLLPINLQPGVLDTILWKLSNDVLELCRI